MAALGPDKVFRATLAGAIIPGAGHILLGRKRAGVVYLLAAVAALAVAGFHFIQGLAFFDGTLGSFLLGHLLRSAAILHFFSVLDAYLLGVDPDGAWAPRPRRLAVILNVLVPGLGYIYVRAWIRSLTGVALTAVFLYFAQAGHHPYLDPIFVAMQALMAVAAYRQIRIQEGSGGKDMMAAAERTVRSTVPAPEQVQSAQVVVLVVGVLALVTLGLVVQERLLPGEITGLSLSDIRHEATANGVEFRISSLGLSMTAVGEGWTASEYQPGSLFRAVHQGQGVIQVGIQLIPAFMDRGRFMGKLKQMGEDQGYTHVKSLDLELGGYPAHQHRFTGKFSHGEQDFWTVAVPRGRFAYVIMMKCIKTSCAALAPYLEKSRDSFNISY